jgi:nitrogen regulatory protein P-II 1
MLNLSGDFKDPIFQTDAEFFPCNCMPFYHNIRSYQYLCKKGSEYNLQDESKLYLFDFATGVMKEIDIYVISDDLPKVTDILRKHNVGGIAFYEIDGRGRTKREEVPEVVRFYMTGRKFTPEFVKRTKVETFVTDSSAKEIVEDLITNLGSESDPRGMVFVKEVSNAYEIGTKQSGEAALTAK